MNIEEMKKEYEKVTGRPYERTPMEPAQPIDPLALALYLVFYLAPVILLLALALFLWGVL